MRRCSSCWGRWRPRDSARCWRPQTRGLTSGWPSVSRLLRRQTPLPTPCRCERGPPHALVGSPGQGSRDIPPSPDLTHPTWSSPSGMGMLQRACRPAVFGSPQPVPAASITPAPVLLVLTMLNRRLTAPAAHPPAPAATAQIHTTTARFPSARSTPNRRCFPLPEAHRTAVTAQHSGPCTNSLCLTFAAPEAGAAPQRISLSFSLR